MKINPWKLSTIILAGALAIALAMPGVNRVEAHKISQPHMAASLIATRTAARQLNKATPNKASHRVKALEHLAAAEAEIQKGIDAGGRHKH